MNKCLWCDDEDNNEFQGVLIIINPLLYNLYYCCLYTVYRILQVEITICGEMAYSV